MLIPLVMWMKGMFFIKLLEFIQQKVKNQVFVVMYSKLRQNAINVTHIVSVGLT